MQLLNNKHDSKISTAYFRETTVYKITKNQENEALNKKIVACGFRLKIVFHLNHDGKTNLILSSFFEKILIPESFDFHPNLLNFLHLIELKHIS